jgi:hypothetical protein
VDDALARRGVPARFRRRLLAELRDHAHDLTNGEGSIMTDCTLTERLGEPAALAAVAAEEYRRARWTSRHPGLVFGLMPLPVTVFVFVSTVLMFGFTAWAISSLAVGDVDNLPRPAVIALAYSLAWGIRFVPFAILAGLFTRLYLRSRVNRWWFVVASTQVLILAGSLVSMINYSDEPGQSQWVLGFMWAPVPVGDGWSLPFAGGPGHGPIGRGGGDGSRLSPPAGGPGMRVLNSGLEGVPRVCPAAPPCYRANGGVPELPAAACIRGTGWAA